jgi:hypothetical protein
MAGGKISGHIEPRDGRDIENDAMNTDKANIWLEYNLDTSGNQIGDTPKPTGFATDTVSGIVTLRGRAQDDQRITAIYLDFGGTARLNILEADTASGQLKRADSLGETDVGLYQELSIDGHIVEWTYRWDSGTVISGVTTDTLGNVTVTVRAEDKSAPSGNAGASTANKGISETKTNAADNADYNSIGLDLAPYITTLTRFKDSSDTVTDTNKAPVLRSKNGWFSFRRSVGDNERMQIEGFNLGDTTATKSVSIDKTTTVETGAFTQNGTSYYINVPAGATSGFVTYTVGTGANSVEAVNNKNDNANSWNTSQEALAGNESSALWNDDRAVHLFDSHALTNTTNRGQFNKGTAQANGKPIYPAMTINSANGTLYASFSSTTIEGSYMPVYYASNTNTNPTKIFQHSDPSEWTDIHYDKTQSRPQTVFMGNVYLTNFNLGGLFMHAATNNQYDWRINQGDNWSVYNVEKFNDATGNNKLYIFQNPRIVTSGGIAYVSYYDEARGQLRYWRRSTSTTGASVNDGTSQNANNNGTNNRAWPQNLDGTSNTALNTSITNTATGTKSAKAGEYSAIDLTSGNVPIIVYQAKDDSGVESVKYAYPDTKTRTAPTGNNWTVAPIPGTTNGGRYISMRIDNNGDNATNDIHITYMDSENGDLMYVHGKFADSADNQSCAYAFDDPVVIDSVGNVGKWADIAIDADKNPVISYLDQGGIDSKTGLKMAFYDSATFGKDGKDGWEYVTLPGRYVVNDVRTQVECDTREARTWNAALAYVSGNDYRISYYIKQKVVSE